MGTTNPANRSRRPWDLVTLVGLLPAVAVLPLLAFAGILMYLLAQQGSTTAQQAFVDANRSLARVVQSELDRATQDLERLASTEPGASPGQARAHLARALVAEEGAFSAVLLVEGDRSTVLAGHDVTSASPTLDDSAPGMGITDLRHQAGGRPGVVEVRVPVAGGTPQLIVGHLNLRRLSRILARHAGERSFATVLDSRRIIIARSTDFDRFFGQLPSAQTLEAVTAQRDGQGRFVTRDGRELFWAWTTLRETQWAVFLGTPARQIDAAFRESLITLLAGTAVALALGSFAAWSVGRRIVRAADDMAEQAPGLVSGRSPEYRSSGLRQIDGLYRAMAAAGQQLNDAHRQRDDALVAEQAARERSERDNRKKDIFIATLSHELRNPLAPIASTARALLSGALSPEEARQAAAVIHRQASSLSHLLDDLLDASRITTGRIQLDIQPTSVMSVAQAAAEAARPLLDQRDHRLDVDVEPKDLAVLGDSLRLVQVLSNLLNNAAKYTPPGGRIQVQAARQDEQHVRISVIDNGIGIPAGSIGRVFDIFEQLDGANPQSGGGLGIGLSLVRGIVEMHGGSVSAASEGTGRGSRFDVLLPQAPAGLMPEAPDPSGPPVENPASRRFLLVDDNVDAAVSMQVLLEVLHGFSVDVAHSGEEALERVSAARYDVICLDIGLPDLDGYELARRIRPQTDAVLVATTGWGSMDDKQRARDAGFDLHMTKPVDADELVARVVDRLPASGPHA
jgi:signal transduction histidine kinase/CheY-like chemotaxis protein